MAERTPIVHPPAAALLAVPMDNHKLECPHCHQPCKVEMLVEARSVGARVVGGTHFRSDISAALDTKIKSVHISHECDYQEDRDG